jgi:transposase-like protein
MDAHMDEEERLSGNRRNGFNRKQVQTSLGEVTVNTTRNRDSRFEPEFIKKRERILAKGVADRIICLYALGKSTREISDWMEENLGNRISADTINAITDRVLPELQSCLDNWHKLSAYFQYTDNIRRQIYTTNTVEGYHRQIRKVTKDKGVFTNNTASEKLVYLVYRNISKKWTIPLKDWGQTARQQAIRFPEEFNFFN